MAEENAATAGFAEEAIGHLDALYRGALRLTRDPDKAQDLVQDAYARALRYQHSYQPGTNMKAWLFAIMRNLYWDRFQKANREAVSIDDIGEFALYDQMRDDLGEGPEAEVLDRIARGEVVEAIEKLNPLHREVGSPGRRRRFLLQGRGQHPWSAHRHRHVAPSSSPPAASKGPLHLRGGIGYRRRRFE